MRVLQRIIVGHDLQRGGALATRSAVALAQPANAQVKLVNVVEPYPFYQRLAHPLTSPYSTEELVQRAGEALQKIIEEMKPVMPRMEYEVRTGKPFVELIMARRAWQADLLVVGKQIEGQDRFLGSTGERVVRKALAPVLIAKRELDERPKIIVMPTDFSTAAKKAAEEAIALVQHFGGRIVFVHVLELPAASTLGYGPAMGALPPMPFISPQELEPEWQAFLDDLPDLTRVDQEHHTIEGQAISVIVETAQQHAADIIVMGTHGRTGLGHMLLGSVAEGVVRQAACSVLTIRPEALQFSLP